MPGAEQLNEREREVLRLLLLGHDAKSIARALDVSVHSVNERLRAARAKLGVTNSREAARILDAAEQESPKSLGAKDFGIADGAGGATVGRASPGRKSLRGWAIGGALLMSAIFAAAFLLWTGPAAESGTWRTASAIPTGTGLPTNVVRLDGTRMVWNGSEISEAQLRTYLDITTQMSPQPVLVFSHSAQTKPARVSDIRRTIDSILHCTPATCVEVGPAGGR